MNYLNIICVSNMCTYIHIILTFHETTSTVMYDAYSLINTKL